MSDDVKSYASWKSLPALGGGVWVAMVTEVLDGEGIPNLVKTDLASGGLGVVTGTDTLGKAWRSNTRHSENPSPRAAAI